jgi:hypothetical protein
MPTLTLKNIGPISDATLEFKDLTVLVGPQASGKSIALQTLKLVLDMGTVQRDLSKDGLNWRRSADDFLQLYFGTGMQEAWVSGQSKVTWERDAYDVRDRATRQQRKSESLAFLIPAQRVMTLREGWPRQFGDYAAGDPYVVRAFSEQLRLLLEASALGSEPIFPRKQALKADYRRLLDNAVFGGFRLSVDLSGQRKRLVLGHNDTASGLPYMVWSAGQREFVPLLLGLYWLMPPSTVPRRDELQWVIVEEPEMGLHPQAVSVVLFLVLELLARDYRVCISTHSPQVLDLIWTLRTLQEHGGTAAELLRVFGVSGTSLRTVAEKALGKRTQVYDFPGHGQPVRDISGLDPTASDPAEASWGGLLDFSGRANDAVATAMARAPFAASPVTEPRR